MRLMQIRGQSPAGPHRSPLVPTAPTEPPVLLLSGHTPSLCAVSWRMPRGSGASEEGCSSLQEWKGGHGHTSLMEAQVQGEQASVDS